MNKSYSKLKLLRKYAFLAFCLISLIKSTVFSIPFHKQLRYSEHPQLRTNFGVGHDKSDGIRTKFRETLQKMFEITETYSQDHEQSSACGQKCMQKTTYDLVSVVTIWVIVVKIFIHIFLTAIFFSAKLPGHSTAL